MKDVIFLCIAFVISVVSVCLYIYSPEWSKVSEQSMSQNEALDYCINLREHGHADWKLPKTGDLATKGFTEGYWASNSKTEKDEVSAPESLRVVCVRNMPEKAGSEAEIVIEEVCLHARKTQTEHAWKLYLEMYPDGACADEARDALDNKQISTKVAQENPNIEPDTKSVPNSRLQLKTDGLEWSDKPVTNISFRDAEKYCRKLKENSNQDWRLPTIDELRSLIKERKTASGGECKVSAKNGCLSSKLENGCWSFETCAEACEHSLDKCSRDNIDGKYSKLGDKIALWSSTQTSDTPSWYWYIDFSNGLLSYGKSNSGSYKLNVRCVR
jgi:uncharacterized protein (TIGR02145 family)